MNLNKILEESESFSCPLTVRVTPSFENEIRTFVEENPRIRLSVLLRTSLEIGFREISRRKNNDTASG